MGAEKEREESLEIFVPKYQVNRNLLGMLRTIIFSCTVSLPIENRR